MSLREKISEVIENQICPIPEDKRDKLHKFYFAEYADNLVCPMSETHRAQYARGNGGELEAQGNKPAKMASLVSSSAMTFNLLGNDCVRIKAGETFGGGEYAVEYEKQMYTLTKGSNPANLDAFLFNAQSREAVFCEMKMLEWLGVPGRLKEAYLDRTYYFNDEAYKVFSEIAKALLHGEKNDRGYRARFNRYDAWQMLKHAMAIYNATSVVGMGGYNNRVTAMLDRSMAGCFRRIILANVVFELDATLIQEEKTREKYVEALQEEHDEAEQFIKAVLDSRYGLRELFEKHCGVDFSVMYISAADFLGQMAKDEKELEQLRRYCGGQTTGT